MIVVLVVIAVLLALYIGLMLVIARVSLKPYRIPLYLSPGALGAPQEEVRIESEGNILRGWWMPAPNAKTVMVVAHGYMMNRSELCPEAYLLWKNGVSCLLLDLRAHGKSQGRKCTLGYHERKDIVAAVEYARSQAPGAKIGLYGSSMGAAASALAVGENPDLADFLILDSPYGRLDSAIMGWWRFVGGHWLEVVLAPSCWVAAVLLGFKPWEVDISQAVANFGAKPILFFHGTKDVIALPSEAKRNHEAALGPVEVVWMEGYGHSEGRWEQAPTYQAALLKFVNEQVNEKG